MSLGRRALVVTRPQGAFDQNGRWQESAALQLTIQASVQPLSGKDLQSLPEGRRASATFDLFTDSALRTADERTGQQADRVRVGDRDYEVIRVHAWQNGILPHYEVVVASMDQPPDGAA